MRKFSGEHKKAMSDAAKKRTVHGMSGKQHTVETRLKISKANIGKKHTEETKRKMGESQKRIGNRPPSPLGRKVSIETREKMRISRLGSKSNLWKGGTSKLTDLLRNCLNYRTWRTSVFERDNYTCQECNQKGGKLNADHINSFNNLLQNMFIELNIYKDTIYRKYFYALSYEPLWATDNGRTLCIECHRLTNNYGRPKNNINFNK